MTRHERAIQYLLNAGIPKPMANRILFHQEMRDEHAAAPKRTHCSVCGKEVKSYRLEPGTGRCTECMP